MARSCRQAAAFAISSRRIPAISAHRPPCLRNRVARTEYRLPDLQLERVDVVA
jgi:hypothetical protein